LSYRTIDEEKRWRLGCSHGMGDPPRPSELRAEGSHRGIRTFLIADVRGYTVFTQQRGDEAATKLAARFASIAREVVQEHGGSVIELRGDEALAAFESPRQAILAAARGQDRFLEETEGDPSLPLPVGIGLDAGEAVPLESGYRGGALNLAARLCGKAGPGEILASQNVVHLAGKVEGVRYVNRGDLHLKGLAEPVRVVRVISEQGDPAEGFRRLAPGRPARGPAPIRLARRHPIAAALVALVLVAAAVVPATIAFRDSSGPQIDGDAVAMIDLESGELQGSVALESRPGDVATGGGSVWVTQPDRGAVLEIDAETMSVVDTVSVGANPVGIAVGADSVWVANGGSSTVSRISPARNNEVVDTIEVPGAPAAVAVNDEGVWVADSVGDAVTPIDPETGRVLAPVAVGDQPTDLADDGEDLWVANAASGSVSRVDPGSGDVQPVDVGEGPQALAVGRDGVWVANFLDGTVSRIDPNTASTEAIRVGGGPTDLALAERFVWVSLGSAGSIKKIALQSGSVTTIPLGSYAGHVAVGDGALWVSVRGPASAHGGGTLTVVGSRSDLDSVDPAVAYSAFTWSILSLTNDGLVGLRRVGGVDGTTIVPYLATSIPDPTEGGRTYRFQLRSGVRYSSGDLVRPDDFRQAIERVLLLGDPIAAGYFFTIDGAAECRPGSCDLSAGIETDDAAGTVTFHLVEPDPDFLNKLTMPFAYAVPAGTPETPALSNTIPATGPYMIDAYSAGEQRGQLVLVRNPEFRQWSAARPDGYPDRIVFRLGSDSERQVNGRVADILEGRADFMWDPPPADRIAELMTTHAGQLHTDPGGATRYMFLNTQVPPFDDERVRRALNYAVDRGAIDDEIYGGAVRVTCQILPPTFPGYVPYCPYTRHPNGTWTAPDLTKARQLVSASGTRGTKVTIWASPDAFRGVGVPIGQYLVDLLDRLGFDATLKVVTSDRYSSAISDPSQHVQMAYLAWGSDYLAESGFIPALTCAATGNDRFCDPTIERRIEQAASMQATDPARSHRLWSSLEHYLVDRAPWVPLGNNVFTSLVSKRLGNYQFHPYWALLYDQMWVR
jgi:ABC-type transport system substrate-binding protein/class 3 adenylate cyclase/DNA-binding beta-propeller fold protein YncE